MSVELHISGTIHHMILINGTHVLKDNVQAFFLHFFEILIVGVNSWAKKQKMT